MPVRGTQRLAAAASSGEPCRQAGTAGNVRRDQKSDAALFAQMKYQGSIVRGRDTMTILEGMRIDAIMPTVLLTFLAVSSASSAQTPPPPTSPPNVIFSEGPPPEPVIHLMSVITEPRWARPLRPHFPRAARSAGIDEGRVVLNCGFGRMGDLTGCRITDETPPGLGFGAAALRAAASARLSARTIDRATGDARAIIPVAFHAVAGETASPP